MSDTPTNLATNGNPLDQSDWSANETLFINVSRDSVADYDATLYRYVNSLDQNVTVTIVATDAQDTTFTDTEELRGSASGSEASLTVQNNSTDSDLITEPWERLSFGINPVANVSVGEFELRSINQGRYRA